MDHFGAVYSANLLQSADTYQRLSSQVAAFSRLQELEESQADANAGAAIWGAVQCGLLQADEIVSMVNELSDAGLEGPDSPDAGGECANLFFRVMTDYIYPMGGGLTPFYRFGDWDTNHDDQQLIRQRELQSQATGCRQLAMLIESPPAQLGTANDKWQFSPGAAVYNETKIIISGISWKLLKALVESEKPLAEAALIEAGWGHDAEKDAKTLQNALSALRRKLRDKLSLTEADDPIPVVDTGRNRAWKIADTLR